MRKELKEMILEDERIEAAVLMGRGAFWERKWGPEYVDALDLYGAEETWLRYVDGSNRGLIKLTSFILYGLDVPGEGA